MWSCTCSHGLAMQIALRYRWHSVRGQRIESVGLLTVVRVAWRMQKGKLSRPNVGEVCFLYQETHRICTRALRKAQRNLLSKKKLKSSKASRPPRDLTSPAFLAWVAPLGIFLDPETHRVDTFKLPEGRCLLRFRPHGCGVLQRGGG